MVKNGWWELTANLEEMEGLLRELGNDQLAE